MGYLGILDSSIHCLRSIDKNHGAIILIDTDFIQIEKSSKFERLVRDVTWLKQKGVDKILLLDDEMCSVYFERIASRFPHLLFMNGLTEMVKKINRENVNHILVISSEECAYSRFYKIEIRKVNPSILVEQTPFESYRQSLPYPMNSTMCEIMLNSIFKNKKVDAVVFGSSCYNSLAPKIELPVVPFEVKLENAFYDKDTYIFATGYEDVLAYEGRDFYQLDYPIDLADVNDVELY